MGKCIICGIDKQKAFLFMPSNKFYFLCIPHFVEYDNQNIKIIDDWIKLKKI